MTATAIRLRRLLAALAGGLLLPTMLGAAGETPPTGWRKTGQNHEEYEIGVDRTIRHSGKASAFLKATAPELHGYGSIVQVASTKSYRGKRVRFSGYLRTSGVRVGWAGLWLRVDGPSEGEVLAFDNMESRPVKGTTDWKQYSIVLDIPERAIGLAYGVILAGDGQVWMDDVTFEVVPRTIPVTGFTPMTVVPTNAPQNLDFEQ
jgi:hypothetical protein